MVLLDLAAGGGVVGGVFNSAVRAVLPQAPQDPGRQSIARVCPQRCAQDDSRRTRHHPPGCDVLRPRRRHRRGTGNTSTRSDVRLLQSRPLWLRAAGLHTHPSLEPGLPANATRKRVRSPQRCPEERFIDRADLTSRLHRAAGRQDGDASLMMS